MKKNESSKNDPRPHIALALISLAFCIPIGAVAFVRAIQAYELLQPDNEVYWPSLATVYSKQALRWSLLGIAVGLCWWTFSAIVYIYWNACTYEGQGYLSNYKLNYPTYKLNC